MSILLWVFVVLLPALPLIFGFGLKLVGFLGQRLGSHLQKRCAQRRDLLLARVAHEKKQLEDQKSQLDEEWEQIERERSQTNVDTPTQVSDDREWNGVVGFFHPFCNAGGGGERVLWKAIQATQHRWPNATCLVYTGDMDVSKDQILKRVKDHFNIQLYSPTIIFLYLSTRSYVLSTTWPHFTLLGQSVGSLLLAYDAFSLLVPDIFIDTMGYAFTLAFSKLLFPLVPTGAYVHYPTISTDMLESLEEGGQGVNAGAGTGRRGAAKRIYWHMFAWLYGWVGSSVDVVMANSSWTKDHISQLWGPKRTARKDALPVEVVFPPVAVDEMVSAIDVSERSESSRKPYLLYIAQFRPEKNHSLIISAFANFIRSNPVRSDAPRLVLVGSVRDDTDEKLVYSLRLLAHELHVKDSVDFVLNASWPSILEHLRTATIGVNGMWNEHFGIGVVEYQAAGLISVVHKSGGPLLDIVVDFDGQATGYHAETEEQFASAFKQALEMEPSTALSMRRRARENSKRFTEEAFAEHWVVHMSQMIGSQVQKQKRR